MCPPTPMSLPRRYYSAGRNRLPWERPERQDTSYFNKVVQPPVSFVLNQWKLGGTRAA